MELPNWSFGNAQGRSSFPLEKLIPSPPIRTHISRIVHAVFSALCFPTRFLGSKSWSIPGLVLRSPKILYILSKKGKEAAISEAFYKGVAQTSRQILRPEETRQLVPSAAVATAVHFTSDKRIRNLSLNFIDLERDLKWEKSHFPPSLKNCSIKKRAFFDEKTGLKVAIVEGNGKIYIAFGAVWSLEYLHPDNRRLTEKIVWRQKKSIGENYLGGTPKIFQQAEEFVRVLEQMDFFQNKKIILTGHCFGGSLAQYVGLKQGKETYCFNSIALGPGLQKKIGKKKLRQAERWITNLSIQSDYISDPHPIIKIFCNKIPSSLGIRSAGNFGKKPLIPDYYRNRGRIHQLVLNSMMIHCGFPENTNPKSEDCE